MLARRLILGRKCRTVRKPQLARSAQLSLSLSLSLSRQPQAVTNTRRILAASRQTLSRIAATASVGGLLILAYLAISPLWFIPTNNAHAAPTNPLKTTSAPSLSLSADKTAIALHLSPNNFGSDNFTITTTTENPTGYTTSISTNSPTETCLIRPSDITNSKTCSTAANTITSVSGSVDSAGTIAPSTLLTNQWGVSVASSFSADPSNDNVWFKIPDNSTPSIVKSSPTATSVSGETQTVTIGAKVDFTLPATTAGDEYQNTIVITAVANDANLQPPTIAGINANTGTITGGQTIDIYGTNFDTAYQAFIDLNNNGDQDIGEECADADIHSDGGSNYSITCKTPATSIANVGNIYDVVVKTWGGATKTTTDPPANNASIHDDFTYTAPAPIITSISPDSGSIYGGTEITITGAYFSDNMQVGFYSDGSLPHCTNVVTVSETELTCTTPASVMTGEVRFVLVNDYDSGNLYSVSDTFGLYFTYFVPTLTSLTPAQCAAMTTFDGTNTTAVIAMLDDTDTSADKYYAVAKLNDGRCWMLSNYAKEYGALITNLSQGWTTSAGLSQAFYADAGNAASSINGTRACTGVGYATTPADAITFLSNSGSATAGSIHNCGYLYSWFGATAGTGIGTMTSTIATDSICPTGWHLPTAANVGTIPNADWGTDRNEFTTMYSNIGGTYAKTVGASSVFRGVHSGLTYTDTSYFLSYQGSQGYLWSSSATATASNAYLFNFSTSVVTPAFATNTYKYYGRAVRCILNAN